MYTSSQKPSCIYTNKITVTVLVVLCAVLILSISIKAQSTAPDTFTGNLSFEIIKGMSVHDIAKKAAQNGVVRSEFFLYVLLTYSYEPTNIYAGTYLFTTPVSVFSVAKKLANKDIEKDLMRVTIPEGLSRTRSAHIIAKVLPNFSTDEYLTLTKDKEGYLFPETYLVPKTFTAQNFVTLQEKTYQKNISPLRTKIQESPLTEYEVLILASIVEREANDDTSMKNVAGVLQNRLAIDMPLQADASIEYVLDKPLSELTPEDLKISSPYNTYIHIGLVPTPIGNPGLMAINAVLHATSSEYYYYITDTNGIFHYAKNFAEHNRNIAKYLR